MGAPASASASFVQLGRRRDRPAGPDRRPVRIRLSRPWWTAFALIAVALLPPRPASAQILSPGALAEAHAELEGIRRCTACHELGKRGIQPARCLDCHEPLADRIRSGVGYHATVSSECAECHKEHLGRDFDLVRLDERAFEHHETGYALRLSHAETDCRACHRSEHVRDEAVRAFQAKPGALDRTFLGLSTGCAACHDPEDPHDGQFDGRSCATCHDESAWTSAPVFDHGSAAFALEGAHRSVDCAACHTRSVDGARVYRPVAFGSCAACHGDPHGGAMGGTCTTCHSVRAWDVLPGTDLAGLFDHGRTSFPLRGAHAGAECAACHRPGRPPSSEVIRMSYRPGTADDAYPRPRAESCASCHVDRHDFPRGSGRWAACASCHVEEAWAPTDFGVVRHAEADFPLEGAHAAVPCVLCHLDPEAGHARFTLALDGRACRDCHADDTPHDASYDAYACERCHVVEAFDVVMFDHAEVVGTGSDPACVGCHASDDPHGGQFADRDCSSCHGTDAFTIEAFDHDATRFPLRGAHERASCAACHGSEQGPKGALVRYVPLPTDCADCHQGVG